MAQGPDKLIVLTGKREALCPDWKPLLNRGGFLLNGITQSRLSRIRAGVYTAAWEDIAMTCPRDDEVFSIRNPIEVGHRRSIPSA